jgi:hypothetical protein
MKMRFFLVASMVLFCILGISEGGSLRKNFYKKSCPQAEQIVKNITQQRVFSRPELPAKLLRLHFHDCFVRVNIHSSLQTSNIFNYMFYTPNLNKLYISNDPIFFPKKKNWCPHNCDREGLGTT